MSIDALLNSKSIEKNLVQEARDYIRKGVLYDKLEDVIIDYCGRNGYPIVESSPGIMIVLSGDKVREFKTILSAIEYALSEIDGIHEDANPDG